jgi:hypothetical protein
MNQTFETFKIESIEQLEALLIELRIIRKLCEEIWAPDNTQAK